MSAEKEKNFIEYIKLVSPGSPLREAIDDLVKAGLGALIVFGNPELQLKNILDGGFKINSKMSSRRLFELGKMDGAIIVSPDLRRILYANVTLMPDVSIKTNETGTRHKAAERTAKQANTFVIAVSERRKKTTLYYGPLKYTLKTPEELIGNITTNLHLLEKQRELFDDSLIKLNILELSDMVSTSDVCKVIQRAEIMLNIADAVKRDFTELGKEGNILHMRYRELLRDVKKAENNVLRDYSKVSLKKSKKLLSNTSFENILHTDYIAKLLFGSESDESRRAKGYRFLSYLPLNEKEISQAVKYFGDLNNFLNASTQELEEFFKERTAEIEKEIKGIKEQILSGKSLH